MQNPVKYMWNILQKEKPEKTAERKGSLEALVEILEQSHLSGSESYRTGHGATSLLGILGFVSAVLYAVGYMPAALATALLLVGWVSATRLELSSSLLFSPGTAHLRAVAFRTLDAAILVGVGLIFILREHASQAVMIWSVAAALTGYLSYYSQVAVLKSVPGRLRTGRPEIVVEADHLFLCRPVLWGPDRELVLGLSAVGLFIGMPDWGMGAAVLTGNLNWVLKITRLWREINRR